MAGLGCSFDPSPIVPKNLGVDNDDSGDAKGLDDEDDEARPPSNAVDAQSDATDATDAQAEDGGLEDGGSADQDGSSGPGPEDGGDPDGTVSDPDASTDASEPEDGGEEPDAGKPDGGEPACDASVECICPHEQRERPDDDCAPKTCPLDDCAPEDDCIFERFESSVYYFCETPHRHETSEDLCKQVGMHLVIIGDEDEDLFLFEHLTGKAWIGAERHEEDEEEDEAIWQWLDGTPFYDLSDDEPIDDAYVNWDDSEPNGLGISPGPVNCLIMWDETGAWADTNCNAQNGYVCELEH